MVYYAYRPDSEGKEPLGTEGKIIRYDLRSDQHFIRHARAALGDSCRVFRCVNFYNEESYTQIYGSKP
jgi:hypothetical protein